MNKHGWLLLTALTALGTGQAQAGEPAAGAAPAAATEPVAALDLRNENWRIGYTLGYSLGQRMGGDVPDLDTTAFQEGFSQAFAQQPPKMTQEEMQQAFESFQQKRIAQLQALRARMLADNLAKSNEFLKQNGKRKGVKTTKSGLQYEILKKGKGPAPAATDLISAHYRGTLPDGTEFDSSIGGDPVEFPLDRVIPGWQEGVRLMSKGSKYKLYLPPALAYGELGAGEGNVIGPNQALVFEVELVDFRAAPPEPPAEMPGATDPAALENAVDPAAAGKQ